MVNCLKVGLKAKILRLTRVLFSLFLDRCRLFSYQFHLFRDLLLLLFFKLLCKSLMILAAPVCEELAGWGVQNWAVWAICDRIPSILAFLFFVGAYLLVRALFYRTSTIQFGRCFQKLFLISHGIKSHLVEVEHWSEANRWVGPARGSFWQFRKRLRPLCEAWLNNCIQCGFSQCVSGFLVLRDCISPVQL